MDQQSFDPELDGTEFAIHSDSKLEACEMDPHEVGTIERFLDSRSEDELDRLDVDATRLPARGIWMGVLQAEGERPYQDRTVLPVIWNVDGVAVGFSVVDQIEFGEQARMHMCIREEDTRGLGLGTKYVRQTACLCFELLRVQRVVCEPHVLNVASNRTLQRAGFRYEATYWAMPTPRDLRRSAVTRWVAERGAFGAA